MPDTLYEMAQANGIGSKERATDMAIVVWFVLSTNVPICSALFPIKDALEIAAETPLLRGMSRASVVLVGSRVYISLAPRCTVPN